MSDSIVDVLDRARTPAEPGPGPISAGSLRALDLAIGRRVDGVISGDFRSGSVGIGTEFYQVRPYAPGDDVRRIDWNVTARTGLTHVRVELAERMLVTWIVFDLSASMAFGTADRRKTDVAEGVAIAIGHVATRRGSRIGVVSFGEGEPVFRQPSQGRRGLLLALGAIRNAPAGNGSLDEALNLVAGRGEAKVARGRDLGLPRPHGLEPRAPARHLAACDPGRRDPRSEGTGTG